MNKTPRVKVTVLKVPKPEDIWDEIPLTIKYGGPCDIHSVGQEIIVDSEEKPEGFCIYAWNALWPYITTIRHGGDFNEFYEETGKALICCIDAVRPVSFLVERI